MSLKRLTVISAVGSHNSFNNQTISYVSSYSGGGGGGGEQGTSGSSGSSNSLRTSGGHHQGLHTMRPGANLHGNVNIMLGGAMLSVVITVVCFVCYCCHRNIKKRSNSLYRQQWLETEANMEIYSVEQCYDAPAASGGGYFMDGGGAGDYQSLPMVGSTINHNGQLPFPYHHLQHQQHYTPYPNGPPPSYDTVVAHDELLACAVSCRGKPRTNCPAEEVAESGCSLEGAPDECKSSCTEALLRKATARARFADGTHHHHHHHHRRGLTRRDVNPDEANDRDVTEPFWRSIELEEAERQEEQREAGEVLRNCGCTVNGRSNGSPIYCRSCGCHVAAETGGGHRVQIDPSTNATSIAAAAGPSDTPLDWLDGISNGPLLVDYDSSTTVGATPSSCSSIPVERSNGMEGGGNSAIVTPATHNNNNNNNNDDSDILTMETATLATLPSPSTVRLDTMNNNDATLRGDTRGCPAEPSANEASRRAANENNNVITGPPRGDAGLIEILIDQRQTDDQDSLQQQRTEDLTNGNGSPGAPGEPQPGIRRLLDENGLVRLDMSQIIDNTGLPTYEAALKLESSGYV